jgi:four helix bundle protein
MPTVDRFEDLDIWKRARALVNLIYDFTEGETFKHDFALRDQIRRVAISILSNISEGFESRTQAMFIEYLGRAKASAGEVRAQSYLAVDRKYVTDDQFNKASEETVICSKQISRLSKYLESRPNARHIREEGANYDV